MNSKLGSGGATALPLVTFVSFVALIAVGCGGDGKATADGHQGEMAGDSGYAGDGSWGSVSYDDSGSTDRHPVPGLDDEGGDLGDAGGADASGADATDDAATIDGGLPPSGDDGGGEGDASPTGDSGADGRAPYTDGGSVSDGGLPLDGGAGVDGGQACVLAPEFGGQAAAALAKGLLVLDVADTGSAAPRAAALGESATAISASIPGVLDLQALVATLDGSGTETHAVAQTAAANGNLVVPNVVIATLIKSDAVARCAGSIPVLVGQSTITNLTIAGVSVVVDGSVNQRLVFPGLLSVTINEQVASSSGVAGTLVVNAVHIKLLSGEDVVVSSATADIDCACAN